MTCLYLIIKLLNADCYWIFLFPGVNVKFSIHVNNNKYKVKSNNYLNNCLRWELFNILNFQY